MPTPAGGNGTVSVGGAAVEVSFSRSGGNAIDPIDDTVVAGSFNFSHIATVNAENVLIVPDSDLAKHYTTFINRLADRYRARG